MPNTYRVDRVNSYRVPCGVNSIIYIGDNWEKARRIFAVTRQGTDTWGAPNAAYGVILSMWDDTKRDYVIKCSKGICS